MYAVAEVTNEQYKEPTGSRLVEVWESGLAKPPSVAIRSLHNVVNRYLRVTRPEEAEDVSNGNVDIIVYLARHDNEEIFPQDIEQRFGVTRSTSCRVLGLMEQKGLIAREPVKRDARLKKIVLTDKSRHIAEVLRDNAKNMVDRRRKPIFKLGNTGTGFWRIAGFAKAAGFARIARIMRWAESA